MKKVVVYESRLQRVIDKIDQLEDDIYWATINAPMPVAIALTLPLSILSDALEALPMKVVHEIVIK